MSTEKKKREFKLCPLRDSACVYEACAWYDKKEQRCEIYIALKKIKIGFVALVESLKLIDSRLEILGKSKDTWQ